MANRTLTDTATISWDEATADQQKGNVVDDSITNAKLANMAPATIKGSVAGGDPADLSDTQVATLLDSFFLTPAEGNAAYQPLDSDLTAIAALTTTAIGRSLLAAADAPALAEIVGVGVTDSPTIVNLTQTGYHDLTEIAAPASPAVNVARVYAVDDGAGVTTAAMKDNAGNVSPLSHFLQLGTGAISRSFYNKNLWRVDAEDYGDVSSDALGCINRAITYVNGTVGGGEVHFEAREYSLTGSVVQKTGVRLVGKGSANTRLKLATNANSAVIETLDFATLLGTGSLAGPSDFAIVGMTLDGNQANQNGAGTEINGMSLYGFRYLIEDVIARDNKRQGLRAEWGQFGEFAMEATIRRLKIDICGRHGMWWRGPHDTFGEDIMIIDAGQETDDAYDGLLIEGFGNGKWVNVHPWHRSTVTNRMARSLRCETGGNDFVACNFEGGRQCILHIGDSNSFSGCYAYANFSTDPMVVLRGNHNRFELRIDSHDTNIASCLQIGDGSSGLYNSQLDITCITTATNAVVITDDDGRNTGTIKTIGSTNAYSGTWSTDSSVFVQRPDGILHAPLGKLTVGNSEGVVGPSALDARSQVLGTTAALAMQFVGRFSADANQPRISQGKSRNATIGSHTIVQSGDILAEFGASGSDGTAFINAAAMRAVVDGTPGTNDMPGAWVWSTTPDGSASLTDALRLGSTGRLTAILPLGGIGYGTGAGGAVTQATSKSTGVTLNTVCGQITMHNANLLTVTNVAFTFTNSNIVATDILDLQIVSGETTPHSYFIGAKCGAGSAVINLFNRTAGTLGEALVITFALKKAVAA